MQKRICTICNKEKSLSEFAKQAEHKDGRSSHCNECRREYGNTRYNENIERERKRSNEWYHKHSEEINLKKREWRKTHRRKDITAESTKKWQELHRKERNGYARKRWQELKKNPKHRINGNMRSALWHALKENKAGRRWESLVRYSLEDLIKHLESQFDENTRWDNYGSYWEIDHIKPRSLFNYYSEEDSEFKECWALNNLQPLEKISNRSKGNRYEVVSCSKDAGTATDHSVEHSIESQG